MPDQMLLLDQLLAASPDAVFLVDEHGEIVRCWGATARVFGYEPDELKGQTIELLVPEGQRSAHPHQREGFTGSGQQRPMGSGLTVEGRHRDGSLVPLDIKLTPVMMEGRRHVAAFARDVTHIAQAQRQLIERKLQLEAMDQEKNRVLGVAAHDLRNPLAALKGFIDLLEAGILGDIGARAPGLVQRVGRSVDYMARLVDGLVDLSVIESGHVRLDLQPTDLCGLVDSVVAMERLAARQRTVGLRVDLPEEMGLVLLDAAKVEQVVHNLVGNAVRYTPDGGEVRVRLWRDPQPPTGWAVLQVDDDGPGIPVEQHALLFRPFTRGQAAAAQDSLGAGLGLAIVHRIVDGHGGSIELSSPPGRGACFTVRLPG